MSGSMHPSALPVAVIGAGPVGLAAAAHLVTRGVPVRLYEAGETVAAHVRSWGHVRLFSPWRFNTDAASTSILRQHGWQEPAGDVLPTGHDLYAAYLEPLAQAPEIEAVTATKSRVRSISRQGIDKVVTRGRADHPFALTIDSPDGVRIDLARAVIDASGTWATPNPLGASGTLAGGEETHASRIVYGIPDILGDDRITYAGKRVLVIGGGHSAANALLDLARLAESDGRMRLIWALRSDNLTRVLGGGAADKLPARSKLGTELKRLIESARLQLIAGFHAERLNEADGAIVVSGQNSSGAASTPAVDRIIVATGLRPDLSLTRELRLDLDPWLESARPLGPLIDPNLHSCGTVYPHGYKELSHPEPGYFAVGIKSYGRAPTFLMATGYEQVRSVAAHLAGDEAAATNVQLVLPETGVCSANPAQTTDAPAGGCRGGAASEKDLCGAEDEAAKAMTDKQFGCGIPAALPEQTRPAACGP